MNKLQQGIKVEMEHKDLAKMIANCKPSCKITAQKVYSTIAKAHLKEDPNYYSKLKKARL